jgi:hypothetical protein
MARLFWQLQLVRLKAMLGHLFRRLRAPFAVSLRAGIALLMIGSLGLAQFGYPVWQVAAKKGDQPFPCQFSRCGCQTADDCRTNCCCHSKQERVAWAVKRNIDPDKVAVLTPAEKLQFTFAAKFVVAKKSSCCQTVKQSSCCSKPSAPKVDSCCEAAGLKAEEEAKELQWVLAINAHKCSGTGVDWIQAGFVAQPPMRVVLQIDPPVVQLVSEVAPVYFSLVAEPLLRPV